MQDLSAQTGALPFDDPHGICKMSPGKLASFQSNPFKAADGPAQLVTTLDGKAVGGILFLPGEILVSGKAHPIAWCSTLYVVPEHRSSLAGIMLILESQRCFHALGGVDVSNMAYPIYKKLGWVDMQMTRYILLRKSKSVLERFLGAGKRAALLRPVVDGALLTHKGLLGVWGRMKTAGLYCKAVESMPDSMNQLLAEKVGSFGCHRSSRWINWILNNSFDPGPRNSKQLYFVYDRHDNLVGYFVIRAKFYSQASHRGFKNVLLGSVLDWMIFDSACVSERAIWLMATNLLSAKNVDAVEICSSCPKTSASLLRWGFRRMGQFHTIFVLDDEGPVIDEAQTSPWRLRQFDGDSGLA